MANPVIAAYNRVRDAESEATTSKMYILRDSHGYYYQIAGDGTFRQRLPSGDERARAFSGGWTMLGLVKFGPFGHMQWLRMSMAEASQIKDWRFKNGSYRYRIIDNDHGTERMSLSVSDLREQES